MAIDSQDDGVFLRELKKKKLVEQYSSLKNKLPIKPQLEMGSRIKLPKGCLIRASIRDSAVTKHLLKITYKKTTTNETKLYTVEPYSFRYVKQNGGLKKALFAWDVEENKIKYFVVRSIMKAEMTDRAYSNRFPIEIAKGIKELSGTPKRLEK